jgi:hypothetical protein
VAPVLNLEKAVSMTSQEQWAWVGDTVGSKAMETLRVSEEIL